MRAEELTAFYDPFIDPATGWWPESFMLRLHDAAKIAYSSVLANGGDGIDLGANLGFHTAGMANAGATRVFAVEANPHMVEAIKERTDIPFDRVSVLHAAIVPTSQDFVSFRISRKYTELGSVDPHYFETFFPQSVHDAELEDVKVHAMTFDELIRRHGVQTGFAKVDLEGIDAKVLTTSDLIFSKRIPFCYETGRDFDAELWNRFENSRYGVYDCFMNRLTVDTFGMPRSPIDRFAFPLEYDVQEIRSELRKFWGL